MAARRGHGEGSIFKDSRGLWTAKIELPPKDGKRRRKVIRRKDKAALLEEMRKAQSDLRLRGDLPTSGVTVEEWFAYWLDQIMPNEVTPGTLAGYRSQVRTHIVPGLGPTTKLDKVTARTIRKMHDRMASMGKSSTYILNAHNIASGAFKSAVREGVLGSNPASLVSPPRKAVVELDVLNLDESLHLLEVLLSRRSDGAQRATSLLTGARRGEVIGLEVDRVGDMLDLSWQLRRLPWSHGCSGRCGFERGADCPERTMKARADYEYRQIKGGLYWTRPKSRKGWRIIPLVDPLRPIIERHLSLTSPNPYGLVFTNDGEPIDPDDDSAAWTALMKEIFGPERAVRLHDLRHTAVDLLYLAEVPEDIIQEIMGHSTRSMTRGYKAKGNQQRLIDAMRQSGALLSPKRTLEIGDASPQAQ